MTVNKLIKELSTIRDDLKDKPIEIICPNGLRVYPKIRYNTKEKYSIDFSKKNIESIVLSWQ